MGLIFAFTAVLFIYRDGGKSQDVTRFCSVTVKNLWELEGMQLMRPPIFSQSQWHSNHVQVKLVSISKLKKNCLPMFWVLPEYEQILMVFSIYTV